MSILEEMFDGQPEPLNERPYSRTQSAIDQAKGKVKGFFGSGQVEQGAQETGQMANQLWNNFKRYIGRKYGSHPQSVPYADVAAFFKGNKLDTSFLGDNTRRGFTPKDVGAALMKAAQKYNTDYASDEDFPEDKPNQQNQQNQPSQPTQSNNSQQPEQQNTGNASVPDKLASLSPADRAKLLKLIS